MQTKTVGPMLLNEKKITPETAQGKFLFFYPKDRLEAARTIGALLDMGFAEEKGTKTPLTPENGLAKGIGVLDGEVFVAPNEGYSGARFGNWECRSEQLDKNYVPPEKRFIQDMFNELCARLDRIERRFDGLERQMEEIKGELAPPPLEKGSLRKTRGQDGAAP